MNEWRPTPNASVDVRGLPLSPEEGFVLSRLDGATNVAQVIALTGLSSEVVLQILGRLEALGAIVGDTAAPAWEPPADIGDFEDSVSLDALDLSVELEEGDETASPTHRQLFETVLHSLTPEQRVEKSKSATEPELSALCFDPVAAVIAALLNNPTFGLSQARLVARHHPTAHGLETLAQRAGFTADAGVRRWLVRNPQLPAGLLRRLFGSQRLLTQYQLCTDRDVPEQNRRTARELMRARFSQGPPEEKIELLFQTEGRCLAQLSLVALDGRTTSLLAGRSYSSALLIQNLARWESCPPPLVAHLLRQEIVKRQPPLRAALARHPNAPPSAKLAR